MARLDPAAAATKWGRNSAAASQDYLAGVQNTDKDPTALAIAAIPRMRQRIIDAIDSGKVANGLRRVGKMGWQAAVLATGKTNYETGVGAAGVTKTQDAFVPLFAYIQQGLNQLASMPNVTDADREARALFMIRWNRGYQKPS